MPASRIVRRPLTERANLVTLVLFNDDELIGPYGAFSFYGSIICSKCAYHVAETPFPGVRMEEEKHSSAEYEPGHDLQVEHEDPTIRFLHRIIRLAVKLLAILMVLVIVWGIGDVIFVLYQRLTQPPYLLLQINDILATFGAFLAVLIAIEIFINISMYLSTDVIPVRLVVATGLMAIARKVIIFDFDTITPLYIFGTAAVVLALGLTYWLITKRS